MPRLTSLSGAQVAILFDDPLGIVEFDEVADVVPQRFNRTLKEQIIHGRIYRNIAELRDAVRDFVELYNAQWIVEKNGYLSPAQARQAWHAAISIRPAA